MWPPQYAVSIAAVRPSHGQARGADDDLDAGPDARTAGRVQRADLDPGRFRGQREDQRVDAGVPVRRLHAVDRNPVRQHGADVEGREPEGHGVTPDEERVRAPQEPIGRKGV